MKIHKTIVSFFNQSWSIVLVSKSLYDMFELTQSVNPWLWNPAQNCVSFDLISLRVLCICQWFFTHGYWTQWKELLLNMHDFSYVSLLFIAYYVYLNIRHWYDRLRMESSYLLEVIQKFATRHYYRSINIVHILKWLNVKDIFVVGWVFFATDVHTWFTLTESQRLSLCYV